jgi:hypothetical protein
MQKHYFRKESTFSLLLLIILAGSPMLSRAQVIHFSRTYSGANEVPANTSTATGTITGTYDTVSNVISYSITFSGLGSNSTAAHFHGPAFPGSNAPVAFAHPGFPAGVTSGSLATTTNTLTQAQEADLLSGKWYSNIHSANLPGGEIRAQIFFDSVYVAPVITCPADTVVSSDNSACSKSVAFAATATGTPAPALQYKIGPTVITSPYTFPRGITTVTAIALNGGGTSTCTFKVTVNDTTRPVITCPANVTVFNDPGICGAAVNYTATATDNCPGVLVTYLPASGTVFPVGTSTVTATATDAAGNTSSCSFTVTVIDNEPPVIDGLEATPDHLWPPNHKMKDVTVDYTATDNCTIIESCVITVSSNEPVNGTGDGDTAPDWEIIDDHHIKLRAERSGNGNGRIYTIKVTCTDQYGNSDSTNTEVRVAHNMSGRSLSGRQNRLNVSIAPNPSNGRFMMNIQTTETSQKINLKITDRSGVIVESRNNLVGNQTIHVGERLAAGLYFVEVQQGDEMHRIKLLKVN